MNSSIDTNDLVLYVHIVKNGSFSGAADKLKIPKSTLSRRINVLEGELGGKVLERGVKGVVMTEFGENVLEIANIIHNKSTELLDYAKSRQKNPKGVLKISVPHDFVELVPKRFFTDFSSSYPDIELELDLSNSLCSMDNGQFDLLIRMTSMGLSSNENLILHRICTFERGLYANPNLIKNQEIAHPDELIEYPGLLFISPDDKVVPWNLHSDNESWTGIPKKNIKGNLIGSMRTLASLGCGIVTLTHILAKPMVNQQLLMRVLPTWWAEPVTMYALSTCRKNLLSAKARVFIEELRSIFNNSK
ncbi:LysR family transcriptional regulator [Morganella morganii]|uniref:LysR family transcriptional regulator n=1 Tax=Morganella morganii TaxID=582 RepID=UPI002368CB38|nr:LysR family transcriptional regulator [Morganella morganii]